MDDFDFKKYLAEGKLLKEDEQPTHRITTNVYYIEDYDLDGFNQEAVPEYEISDVSDMLKYDGNYLYIKSGTEGIYKDGMFTTLDDSDTRVKSGYAEEI